jgi:uncharacterized paraquat-inducible protein A
MSESDGGAPWWQVAAAFLLVSAPLYLLMRAIVKLVREAYGFSPAEPDEGPPLTICGACHNTVMEPDFSHCPYCGAKLPERARDGTL